MKDVLLMSICLVMALLSLKQWRGSLMIYAGMKMYVWEEAGMKGGPCTFELPKA